MKSVASWDPEQHDGQSLPPVPVVALGFVQCMGHLPADRAVWPPRGWGGGAAGKPGCRGGREATLSRAAFWLGWGPVVRRRVRGSEMQLNKVRKKPQTLCSTSPCNLPFTRFTRRKIIWSSCCDVVAGTRVHPGPLAARRGPGADGLLSAAPSVEPFPVALL